MNELSLFNRLFNNEDFGLSFPAFDGRACVTPNVDVKQTKDAYVLDMDLPGKTENDVDISLKEDVLTISSHEEEVKNAKADDKEEENSEWLIRERHSYNFTRRFTLPQDVNAEEVQATFKNGVLTIVMPRKPVAEPKKIAIKVA
ncbi:MAG: Hsp20/alpha crystallin family protein [Treponema sp.]|nr:Hsp20/alpha crystallin family protein [Treponema sp.]